MTAQVSGQPNLRLLPSAFLEHIAEILPLHLSLEDFAAVCQRPLRRSIRVNTLKIQVPDFVRRMESKGWQLQPVPWCEEGFWILQAGDEGVSLGNTAEHLAGLFYIQEASSMLPVAALLMDQPVDKLDLVLDAAAAPGSKTTQLAASLGNRGLIIANEFSESRIKGLYSNLQRSGVINVAMTNYDAACLGGWLPETFDAILLDAPCSGEGTIRKVESALAQWSLAAITAMGRIQQGLLDSAFRALKPGGVLVYSTCTLSHQENQHVCAALQAAYGDAVTFESLGELFPGAERSLTPEGYLHVWPQIYDSEGFFVARIRKLRSIEPEPVAPCKLGRFPFTPLPDRDEVQLTRQLQERYGIALSGNLFKRDKEIWLFPPPLGRVVGRLKLDRVGIRVGEQHKQEARLSHEWALAFGDNAQSGFVELTALQAREFMMGRDLYLDAHPKGKGDVLVRYQGHTLGLGRWVGQRLKNNLPRELVRDANLFTG